MPSRTKTDQTNVDMNENGTEETQTPTGTPLNYYDAAEGPQEPVEHIDTGEEYTDLGQGSSPAAALLAALNTPVNQDRVKQAISDLYLEAGTYKWTKSCDVHPSLNGEDRKPGDVSRAGRLVVSVSGTVRNVETGKVGRFQGFSFSPDRRLSPTGEEDFMYQNHSRVAELYLKKSGRCYTNQTELIQFLQNANYGMSISLSKRQQNFLRGFVA